ncbi:MAG: SycD/LcrH family type III secretion system chaperone [Pseudomonadota bacterium]
MDGTQELTEEHIREALVRTGKVPEGDPEGVGDAFVGLFTGTTAMRDIQGLSDDEIESMYALGFSQFQAGRYEEAEKIFALVCTMEHRERKYWMALGAARFNREQYETAVMAYSMAAIMAPGNPEPPLQAADSLMKLGDGGRARAALELAIENAGSDAAHAKLRAKAETLLELIGEET